jgi:hypothetical protein
MRSFIICTHPQILLGSSRKANEVGRACGARFWWESPRHRWADWIGLALDRDRWQAGVNALMNLQVLAPRS